SRVLTWFRPMTRYCPFGACTCIMPPAYSGFRIAMYTEMQERKYNETPSTPWLWKILPSHFSRLNSELLTWYLGNLSAFWACWARCDRVMDLELSSWKPRVGLIQGLAESLENSRSMRRTEWGQRDTELIFDGFEIGGVL